MLALAEFYKIPWKLRKNNFFDNLIYIFSRKKMVSETFLFKSNLFFKEMEYKSDLNPIVIGGCPRSGTTLARSMIGMHPKLISLKKEYHLLIGLEIKKNLKDVFNFSDEKIDDLYGKNKDLVHLSENILKEYIKKHHNNLILLKHPHHITIIDELFRFFPKLKFIHVIRDGRDVACSLRNIPNRKIVNGKIVKLNTRNPFDWCIRKWIVSIKNGKRWRENDAYLEIKYENLIDDPINTIRKIYRFLNLEMIEPDKILNFYKFEKEKDHPYTIEVGKKIYGKSVNRWKKDMTQKEKKLFKKMANPLLIDLDYEVDLDW